MSNINDNDIMLGKKSEGHDWYFFKKLFMVLQYMVQKPTSQSPVWIIRVDSAEL